MARIDNTILVTGAAGQLGRGIVQHLLQDEDVEPARIIATTRRPDHLADLDARGVSVRAADFDDERSLERAFAGADTILLISTDRLDLAGGARLRQHQAAVAAAARAGAAHLAYTSMLAPEPPSPFVLANDHWCTEQTIVASGASFTIFRSSSYAENLLTALPAIVPTGRWTTSAGEGRVAYAARDDMAAAISARLAHGPGPNEILNLTGREAFRHRDVAQLVTELTGRAIEIVPVLDDELVEILLGAGMPADVARLAASVDANVRAGKSDLVTDTIERLTGRAPMPLRRFIELHVAKLTD
jgi:NAD(P)H dehydrogenase (quinone)